MKYRVIIVRSKLYEVDLKAKSEDEAEEKALVLWHKDHRHKSFDEAVDVVEVETLDD